MSQKLKDLYLEYLFGYRNSITKDQVKTMELMPQNKFELDELIEIQTSFLQGYLDAERDRIAVSEKSREFEFKSFLKFKSWYSENYPKTTKKNTGKKKNKVPEVVEEEDTTVEDFEEAV